MLTVTQAASECLSRMLDEGDVPHEVTLRFVVEEEGGLTPTLGVPCPGDATFAHEGRIILALDPRASDLLAQRSLDTRETSFGTQLFPG